MAENVITKETPKNHKDDGSTEIRLPKGEVTLSSPCEVSLRHLEWNLISIVGQVQVPNIAYEKTVIARTTFTNWNDFSDIMARWRHGDGVRDNFFFQASWPDHAAVAELAICCDQAGWKQWDNNHRRNYFIRRMSSPDAALPLGTQLPVKLYQSEQDDMDAAAKTKKAAMSLFRPKYQPDAENQDGTEGEFIHKINDQKVRRYDGQHEDWKDEELMCKQKGEKKCQPTSEEQEKRKNELKLAEKSEKKNQPYKPEQDVKKEEQRAIEMKEEENRQNAQAEGRTKREVQCEKENMLISSETNEINVAVKNKTLPLLQPETESQPQTQNQGKETNKPLHQEIKEKEADKVGKRFSTWAGIKISVRKKAGWMFGLCFERGGKKSLNDTAYD